MNSRILTQFQKINFLKKSFYIFVAILFLFPLRASLYSPNSKVHKSTNLYSDAQNTKFNINNLLLEHSGQVIVVEASSSSSVHTSFKAYEKTDKDTWKLKLSTKAVIGRKGVKADRHEGDLTTPEGIFSFLFEFGRAKNPGTKMKYKQTHSGDYWVSTRDKHYNTWISYKGNPNLKFGYGNYENLYTQPLYKYAAALDFNYGKHKVIGKGSAIFMHIAPYSGKGTAGCIGISESNLLKVLRWMDPEKNPKIIIGTSNFLNSITEKNE